MAKKGEHRITIGLVCAVCKNRNYVTTKNKLNTEQKLLLKKYCRHCKKKTEHKETEKLK
ncbi:MAG: 50S ribosomal protein L33 [Candidatus Levybacteria bacterium RIFCSPLOWO2_01_FULL_38_21]|nr:MAG: 50S ribosomal protein L33 [Candidatus Levybacteria bacterium RIFCSPLOWO2_01_FULL_38_21]